MKKITLLSMLFTLAICFNSYAQFPEDFEAAVPPVGWASFIGTNGEGTVQNWTTSTTAANGSAQAAFVRYESVASSAEDWLVTPQFTPTVATPILTFMQRQGFGSDYGTTYTIRVSTASQTTHADFTIIDTQVEADFNTIYNAHNVDLSAYNGTPIYVAFVMEQNDGDDWYIDDVNLISNASPPNCADTPSPVDMATNVAGGTVTLSWTPSATGDPATSYEVFWGTTSGSLSSLGSLSATTVDITGVGFSTTYYWMIVPSNVGGAATGCAEWSLTTGAPPVGALCTNAIVVATLPYNTTDDTANYGDNYTGSPGATGCGTTSSYLDGDDVVYEYTATADGTINIAMSGISSTYSGIFVYTDCADIGVVCANGIANSGSGDRVFDLAVTNGTTYYIVISSWPSPQSVTYTLDITENTCVNPTATYTVVNDCDVSGGFLIDVDVTDLGSATSLTVSDGTTTMPVAATGVVQFGPYTNATDVTITVTNDQDNSCQLSSGAITQSACPPTNDTAAGAIPITPSPQGSGCATFTFTDSAAGDGTTDSGLDGTCDTTNTGLDRFYTWTATTLALIWNDGDGNPGIVIREATPPYNEITCEGTFAGADTQLSGWSMGQDLIIQIYDYAVADVNTSFCLELYTPPTCMDPTTLSALVTETTASLSWTAGGSETTWNVEWGTGGFTQGTGTMVVGATNPENITGLTATTSYDFYVQADCGGGDLSAWVGPFNFTTSAAPIVPDYLNDFTAYPGSGWSEASGAYGTPTGTSSFWGGGNFIGDAGHANGNSAELNIYGTSRDEYLISPVFDLSGTTYYLNMDIALTLYNNPNPGTLGVDDYVALLVTQDGGASWSELTRWDSSSTISNTGEAISEIVLNGYNATSQFAIYGFSDTSNEDNDFFVDNFQITSSTLSVENNIIDGFSIYPNPVNDILRLNALDNIDRVSVYNVLGQEVMKTQPKVLNTQLDMTNLPTGMYVIKVQVGTQLGAYRIMKK